MKLFVTTCLAIVAGSACSGSIGIDSGSGGDEGGNSNSSAGGSGGGNTDPVINPEDVLESKACQEANPGASPMRRLSNAEYRNTMIDLLGMATQVQAATAGFTPESESLGFRNNADFLPVSSVAATQFSDAAEKLALAASTDANFVKCATPNDRPACGREIIGRFGARAYRRPLTTEESTRFQTMFTDAMTKYDFAAGVEWVVFAMLQSPSFLYRAEHGQPVTGKSYLRPDHYEMASRLSYLMWQSMPDAALFEAAKQGKLGTAAEVLDQAKRMLADGKSERSLEFFRQWLDTDQLDHFSRDTAVFKNLPANLSTLFDKEVDAFTRTLMVGGEGTFADLVSAPYTYVNADLARHYGLAGTFGADFVRSDSATASGVLTQAGFLTVHDKPTRTSIVLRGMKVRTDVMCQLIPAPPNDVQLNLDKLAAGLSQKERLALHRTEPSCAVCHDRIDPVGVVFEGYDAVGRPRTIDEIGQPVDTRSEIVESLDIDGPVANPLELGKKFATSNEAQQCYLSQNFRFFYGRDYAAADLCSRGQLAQAWKESGYNLKEMLLALTQTDAFLYRAPIN